MTSRPPLPFSRLGPDRPICPVVLSVPHAGRDYPSALLDRALPSRTALESLEDRFANLLIGDAVAHGAVAIVAHSPRAWLDLNRDPRELDAAMLTPAPPPGEILPSAKVRHGLGLIPRRLSGGASILPGRISLEDVRARIREVHEPYHRALSLALEEARKSFGVAILLDCHSMPPLPLLEGLEPAELVLGDLHGRSAGGRFMVAASEAVRAAGLRQAHNTPYAGAYILRRHGHPLRGVHAIQIEVDRTLYLDAEQREPSAGLHRIAALIDAIALAVSHEASGTPLPAAAE